MANDDKDARGEETGMMIQQIVDLIKDLTRDVILWPANGNSGSAEKRGLHVFITRLANSIIIACSIRGRTKGSVELVVITLVINGSPPEVTIVYCDGTWEPAGLVRQLISCHPEKVHCVAHVLRDLAT